MFDETPQLPVTPEDSKTETEKINFYSVEKAHNGYKIIVDSRDTAGMIARNFWLENFPETSRHFEDGMWDSKKDEITYHGERTAVYSAYKKTADGQDLFQVLIYGNGQMLKPKSEQWLINKGFIDPYKDY